jgi:cobalt-zinc-cadmium efflux system outer membrane protein
MHRFIPIALAAVALSSLPPIRPASGDELPSPLALGDVIAAVRSHNPLLAERRRRASAAAIKPRAAGLPDDPMVMFEWWQQPVDFATVPLMVTVKQKLPWPTTLRLQREVAEREGRTAGDDADQTQRQVEADARRAYFDLALAERSIDVNEHVQALEHHLVEVSDALYRVGKSTQADLFKAQSELLTVENERLDLERNRDEAIARLNALLDRPASAPLGPTATLPQIVPLPDESELVKRALATSPALGRARHELAAAESRVALARRERLPDLSVWTGFMLNIRGTDTFTAGVSSSLPIFATRRERVLVEAADVEVQAARHGLDAARRDAELAVHTALLQLDMAARHVRLHAEKLVPLADLTIDSAEAAYRAGRGDFPSVLEAARMVRDHHENHIKYLVEYRRRLADLEQVVGDLDEPGAAP